MSGSLAYGCIYVRSVEVATTSVRQFYMQIKLEMEPSRSTLLNLPSVPHESAHPQSVSDVTRSDVPRAPFAPV